MVSAWQLGVTLRILNVLDVLGTLYTVKVLGAEEANPVWAWLLDRSPVAFVFVKIIGVAFFSASLAVNDRRKTLMVLIVFYVMALASHAACLR